MYISPYKIGDLVVVKSKWKKYPHYVHTSLETLMSSSNVGDAMVYAGDVGIVVETPDVWGKGPGLVFGVLFHDQKKYISFSRLELLRASANK